MKEYSRKAKEIMKTLESYGVDLDPIKYDFMSSHIPVGPLHSREDGIDKKIYQNAEKSQEFSMYIHIPFCRNHCHYCFYNAIYSPKEPLINKYMNYLLSKELPLLEEKVDLKSENLKVIYIGGGTPTFLKEGWLDKLLQKIRDKTQNNVSIEIEAHPNTLTETKMKTLKKYDVDRLSIGVQSFDDSLLQACRRYQTKDEAIYSIKNAMNYFDNLNIDMIYGLPFQTTEHIQRDLEIIEQLNVPSITWYQLWVTSRKDKIPIKIAKDIKLSKEDIIATRFLINKELSKLGYENIFNDWYLKTEKIIPKYEAARIEAMNNIGLGLSAYLFVEPYIFENTSSGEKYFEYIDRGILPIKWWRKMEPQDLEIRKLAMRVKDGDLSRINLEKLPKDVKKRVANLSKKGVLIGRSGSLRVADEFMPINKDYIAKYLIGDAWFIRKDKG